MTCDDTPDHIHQCMICGMRRVINNLPPGTFTNEDWHKLVDTATKKMETGIL